MYLYLSRALPSCFNFHLDSRGGGGITKPKSNRDTHTKMKNNSMLESKAFHAGFSGSRLDVERVYIFGGIFSTERHRVPICKYTYYVESVMLLLHECI